MPTLVQGGWGYYGLLDAADLRRSKRSPTETCTDTISWKGAKGITAKGITSRGITAKGIGKNDLKTL